MECVQKPKSLKESIKQKIDKICKGGGGGGFCERGRGITSGKITAQHFSQKIFLVFCFAEINYSPDFLSVLSVM